MDVIFEDCLRASETLNHRLTAFIILDRIYRNSHMEYRILVAGDGPMSKIGHKLPENGTKMQCWQKFVKLLANLDPIHSFNCHQLLKYYSSLSVGEFSVCIVQNNYVLR